ncbi:rhodanese-like domain-containing protein [Aerococcus sp. UMB1112A]|uniref:sulfurtransferase n=1 Tax=Aerococcus sp. UMB1112A TaxID=3050609 RepID=UPI00254AA27F|nr:rhodanese-like domain-containing protein [Aerococcus sp. UMB1112A]MDK8502425.1 rhodanese-like domain-containing protein [Aerococcus sp. UMB1112A]
MLQRLSTEKLKDFIQIGAVTLLDTRSATAYAGWLDDLRAGGGHIAGSRLFSADWILFLDQAIMSSREAKFRRDQLVERSQYFIQQNNIEKIVLIDDDPERCEQVGQFLAHFMPSDSQYFYYCFSDWKDRLESYPHYDKIVPATWLNAVISGQQPDHYTTSNYQIFECDWGRAGITYLSSHIPGAVHLDTEDFEQAPAWTHRSLEELQSFVEKYQIDPQATIILYSNGDQGAEYKTALILEALGYPHVRILSGGYSPWRIHGFATERGKDSPVHGDSVPFPVGADFSCLKSIEEVREICRGESLGSLVDIRQWAEYRGEMTGYDYIHQAGRIPGAVYGGSWVNYKNIDDSLPDQTYFSDQLSQHQLDLGQDLTLFCGSAGWGASILYYFAYVYGYTQLSLYEGGWCEWQLDPTNPIDTEVLPAKD